MTGLDPSSLDPARIIRDSNGHPTTLIAPTQLKRTGKSPKFATGGGTHSILVRNGRAFAWGKNHGYECGQGHSDDIVKPTKLITGRKGELRGWVWAGAGHQFGMLASHTRNTQRWDRSLNELRSPASATDGRAGPPEQYAFSSSVSDETRPSGESPAWGRDWRAGPSGRRGESSSVASRARSYGRSREPIDPRIVSGNRPFSREREGPLRLMGDEPSPEVELQPGSGSPQSSIKRPKPVGPVVGRRSTGPGRPRHIMELRLGIPMPLDYSERSLGAMTSSPPTPPDSQRDAGIQWEPLGTDIAELDSAMLGWGPESHRKEPKRMQEEEEAPCYAYRRLERLPARTSPTPMARRRRQSPPQSAKASNRHSATEERQHIVCTLRQPPPQI